jgi:hypothetical protein
MPNFVSAGLIEGKKIQETFRWAESAVLEKLSNIRRPLSTVSRFFGT